jgi:hypothetical protein
MNGSRLCSIMRWLANVLVVPALLTGCGVAQQTSPTSMHTTPAATGAASAEVTPASPQAIIPPEAGFVFQACSTPADVGQAYPFRLFTHCGADYAVDFDGSFWTLTDPATVRRPLAIHTRMAR